YGSIGRAYGDPLTGSALPGPKQPRVLTPQSVEASTLLCNLICDTALGSSIAALCVKLAAPFCVTSNPVSSGWCTAKIAAACFFAATAGCFAACDKLFGCGDEQKECGVGVCCSRCDDCSPGGNCVTNASNLCGTVCCPHDKPFCVNGTCQRCPP